MGALLQMDEKTKEYRENMGKVNTAWEAAGKTSELAKEAYTELYKVLGDQDQATEAAQLMAQLAENSSDVSTWTNIAAGVYGTFGDALPIEGLIEAANETAKVGQVTGALADALNWAGISEDAFNEKLAACGSEEERNKLITETLSATYQGATETFKANNEQVIAAREAQAKLDEATGKLGETVGSLKTKFLTEFAPSIANVVSAFVDLTNGVDGAETALKESVQAMVNKITEMLPEFLSFGIDIISNILSGIIQNLPTLLAEIPGLIGEIISAIGQLGKEFFNAGAEILGQLWEGLKAKWEALKNWVSEKVSWIADKLFFWRQAEDEMGGDAPDGSHASGLPRVPYDNYRAILHQGEMVLNAQDSNALLQKLSMPDPVSEQALKEIREQIKREQEKPQQTIINQYIEAVPMTPAELARQSVDAFKRLRWT